MLRRIVGVSAAVAAPDAAAAGASGAREDAAPAPASTSGMIASRCSVSTATCGSRPASANAASINRRIDVPGGVTMRGTEASSPIEIRFLSDRGDEGGRITANSCTASCSATSPGSPAGRPASATSA